MSGFYVGANDSNSGPHTSKQAFYQLSYLSGPRAEIWDSENSKEKLRELEGWNYVQWLRRKWDPYKIYRIKQRRINFFITLSWRCLRLIVDATPESLIWYWIQIIMSQIASVFLQSSWCSANEENRSSSDSGAFWFSYREALSNREAEAWDDEP